MFNQFAENFKDLLRIHNITQKQIADEIGVKANTVNQWINGKREPEFDYLLKICVLLNTNPTELLGFNKVKNLMELTDILEKGYKRALANLKNHKL